MDYLSVSRCKWKKQHYQAYVRDLETRLQRETDIESHLRAHADRERSQLALIEQLKADHKSELTQVRESLTGAVKKLREDREQLLKAIPESVRSQSRERSPYAQPRLLAAARGSASCPKRSSPLLVVP